MVLLYTGVWARCWRKPTDSHHMLTKARGGVILDEIGETYHKANLCRIHHQMADGGDAYAGGLLIDGYVRTLDNGRVVYYGSDTYLSSRYPIEQENNGDDTGAADVWDGSQDPNRRERELRAGEGGTELSWRVGALIRGAPPA